MHRAVLATACFAVLAAAPGARAETAQTVLGHMIPLVYYGQKCGIDLTPEQATLQRVGQAMQAKSGISDAVMEQTYNEVTPQLPQVDCAGFKAMFPGELEKSEAEADEVD